MATARRQSPGLATLDAVARQCKTGWPTGVTVLTGADLYHLDKAQRLLLDSLLPPGSSEFALTVFGDPRTDVATAVGAARSAAMFADRRVVLVKDGAGLEGEPQVLLDYAAAPAPRSHLIVRAPALDGRRRMHQSLVRAGKLLDFKAAEGQDLEARADDVLALAEERGLRLERDAALLIAEACGGDFYRMDTELGKARAWAAGQDATLSVADVRQVATGSAALSALVDRGVPARAAVRTARLWAEAESAALVGLERYSMDELLRFPGLLLEADRTLKSRALEPRAVLGAMLSRMLPAVQGER
jgi:DNA polymerase III delta subunit